MIKSSSDPPLQPPDHTPDTGCTLCKEKDQRIADLQKSVEIWEANFKSLSASFQSVIDTQNSLIQSLQEKIDQQHHSDSENE